MAERLKPDICVIGAGAGGIQVALAAAAFGVPVVLVEKGAMGGDLNYGSVPSKALAAAARTAQAMRDAVSFGLAQGPVEPDFKALSQHIADVVASVAPASAVERLAAVGVRVVKAEARFKDRRTLIAGDFEIRARRFVIATGSTPFIPQAPGLDGVDYMTTDTVYTQTRRPAHLVIVGAGASGLEMAQSYRRLGSEVTIIEAYTALGREDPEMAGVVLRRLRTEGITILENAKIQGVERRAKGGVRFYLAAGAGQRVVDGSHILIAAGRRPNVETLGLEAARIAFDRKAGIKVSPKLRTTNSRVYAIGDATGGPYAANIAVHHAGQVLRALLFRMAARADARKVARVIFTDPELARVGLTEAEAAASFGRPQVLRWAYAENDRARAERRTEGHVKIVASREGRILGAAIAGANAGELIGMWALAVGKQLTLKDVSDFMPPYPTMTQIGHRAAALEQAAAARRPGLRRLNRFLRMFG